MSLFEYYLQYLTAICEGTLTVPQLQPEKTEPMERAMELQQKISAMGIPAFVRLCAEAEGTEIPQQLYDDFDPQALAAAMRQAMAAKGQEEPKPDVQPEEAPAQKQNAYEAMLDCLCLEDALLDYLIEVLKADDGLAFFRLSQVTVRREVKLADFLFWFATKELYAEEAERACVTIMDTCLCRLAEEGKMEVVAALVSGDRTTFELVRCEAPELLHLPEATYEWYEEYYLNRYYPIRMIMKLRGVKFPEFSLEGKQ